MLTSLHAPAMPYPAIDRTCLAVVAYTEARGEGVAGMAAVDAVVLERVHDKKHRWPTSICGVVLQPSQFSGIERWSPTNVDRKSWDSAAALAMLAIDGNVMAPDQCRGATYFDTHGNTRGRQVLCKIGKHTFYRSAQ